MPLPKLPKIGVVRGTVPKIPKPKIEFGGMQSKLVPPIRAGQSSVGAKLNLASRL